jgi:hypothetical protein
MMKKSLDDWDWPEAGRCEKCGKPGLYAGGYVDDDGWEVLYFLCAACDELSQEVAEACFATKH